VPALLTFLTYIALEGVAAAYIKAIAIRLRWLFDHLAFLWRLLEAIPRFVFEQIAKIIRSRIHLGFVCFAAAAPCYFSGVAWAVRLSYLLLGLGLFLWSDIAALKEVATAILLLLQDVDVFSQVLSVLSLTVVGVAVHLEHYLPAVFLAMFFVTGLLLLNIFTAARLVGLLGAYAYYNDTSEHSTGVHVALGAGVLLVGFASLGIVAIRSPGSERHHQHSM
jgi:hypothetical protein